MFSSRHLVVIATLLSILSTRWTGIYDAPIQDHAAEVSLYVATSGSDQGKGTLDDPFATLNRARSEVRSVIRATDDIARKSITVWIRGGVYPLAESFALGPQDSGVSEAARVIYSAYPDEEVRIIGGRTIPQSAGMPVTDETIRKRLGANSVNISAFDLKALGISDLGQLRQRGHGQPVEPAPIELFINHEPMVLARYPNSGSMAIGNIIDAGSIPRVGDYSNRGATFEFTDDRHERWVGVDDVWLQGTFMWGYADDLIRVESIDPGTKQVKLASPHMYGVGTGAEYRQYYAINVLEELDSPGEYYVDRRNGMLYVWPSYSSSSSVATPARHRNDDKFPEIAVSMLDEPLVRLDDASYITIRDVTIEYGRGMGIYIEDGANNVVLGSTIRNVGTMGVMMGRGARQTTIGITHDDYEGEEASGVIGSLLTHLYHNITWNRNAGTGHVVRGCDVYNTGAGGIFISGGDRRTLTPGGAVAENNRAWNNQRRNKFLWAGIGVDGVGNRVAHNEIFDSDYQAIMVYGNEHVFEYNHVHHIGMDSDDTSPWYTGRDPSGRGHIVRYNYFHDIGRKDRMGMGVYLDDGTSGVQVYGNIFDRVASYGTVYSNSGSDNVITNNIFLNGFGPALHIKSMWYSWAIPNIPGYWNENGIFPSRLKDQIDITAPPYSTRYPELTEFMNVESPTGRPGDDGPIYFGMKPRRNVFSRNLVVNYEEVLRLDYPNIELTVENNWLTNADPGFANRSERNYALTDTAQVYRRIPGFERIPWEKIGVIR